MKMNTKLFAILGAAALAATTAVAKPSGETVHFSIHTTLADTGVEPGSAGTVSANQVSQGSKLNQKLDVSVSGLSTNTDYTLTANTTGSGTVTLDPFTTDNKGRASLHLSNGNGGKNTITLPDGFDLTQVTEIDVINGGSTAVLSSASSTPKAFQYTVKKDISTNDITGSLQITANTKNTKFNLNASGLDANTDYQLVFNGTAVQTYTTDSKGRLKIKSAPTPSNIMDLHTVEVWDSTNTAVLSTTVP